MKNISFPDKKKVFFQNKKKSQCPEEEDPELLENRVKCLMMTTACLN
jgi:hypothetical protein